MNLNLNPVEIRIVGSLIEKEITTPEYYPMSLNALTNACNQKSNREPVMNLQEKDVLNAIDTLRDKKFVWQLSSAGGRVPKYEHNMRSLFTFSKQETAVLCTLFLRGPQTVGEIRQRAERMYSFTSLEETEQVIKELIENPNGPFVIELPRLPGRKESRYMHLFSGMPEITEIPENLSYSRIELPSDQSEKNRMQVLEDEIKELRTDFEELKAAFYELKKQLE